MGSTVRNEPRTAGFPRGESESNVGQRPPAEQRTVRVLIVDDEVPACKLLAVILAPPAFHCSTAHDGIEALEVLRSESFDAVISDLTMPGVGGIKLLEQVRRVYAHLAFLVTTGVDDVQVAVEAMRLGADDYLVKPLHEDAVVASLEKALYKHRLEQEVERYREHLEEMIVERTGEVRSALKQIECTYEDTLQALGAAMDLRDHTTAGHCRRVCLFAMELGRASGWRDERLSNLARGAYLHDIGKLGVPDKILLKPGPLDVEEREVMQRHPQIGFDLIKNIPFLAPAAEIVLNHHERHDGLGYPQGLMGRDIPQSSLIFSIADTLDAMTSERPYRRASSFDEAHDTIRKLSGTQFDPQSIEVFLEIPRDVWSALAATLPAGADALRV
jgi:response regulator RpfG family c-di-GMP phosphodiesterase